MGNLEKAGVGVVVVLLGIILGVAFFSNGEQNRRPLQALEHETSGTNRVAESPRDAVKPPATPPSNERANGGDGALPNRIDGDETVNEGERTPASQPPREEPPTPRPIDAPPSPAVKKQPIDASGPEAENEWPKKVKVEKTDTSLIAMSRRVYGAKAGDAMVPAILKANPALKPTAMRIGQTVSMPEPAATVPAGEKVVSEVEKAATTKSTKTAPAKDAGKSKRRLAFQPKR